MPGGVIGKSMLFGYPGTFAREGDCIVRARIVKMGTPEIAFGDPVVLDSTDTWVRFATPKVAADFAGIAVREVKQAAVFPMSDFAYKEGQTCDVLERGSIMVLCVNGSPAPGGAVYVRITANGGNVTLGGLESVADGGNSLELPSARWAGTKDANNVAELVILSRLQP